MSHNTLALVFCIHHKPWLIMSTLLTLQLQKYQQFDIYFLYQVGDGSCEDKTSYFEYFEIANKFGVNPQLSPYDSRVKEVVKACQYGNSYDIELENDHGLDSGAFLKFIKTCLWERYEHVFFIQEGTVFTSDLVLSSALEFMKKNTIHFLATGHEKRRMSRKTLIGKDYPGVAGDEFKLYQREKIESVFHVFCRDKDFKEIYNQWHGNDIGSTEHHVPDVKFSYFQKVRHSITTLRHHCDFPLFNRAIYVDGFRRSYDKIISDYKILNKITFHKENNPFWFGCSCQHIFTHEFLKKLTAKMEFHKMYDALDIPFAGCALEPIWGFMPKWLGYEKWFFDGIHRIRKDFTNYRREDDAKGMCAYINTYFGGDLEVVEDGDYVKIKKCNKKYDHLRHRLGSAYFV